MNKEELNRLAMDLAEFMSERGDSFLTLMAQVALDNNRHIEYLKMMWEQSNQATKQVKEILGTELFKKIKNLKATDFD